MKDYKKILENCIVDIYGAIPSDTRFYSKEEWLQSPRSEYLDDALSFATFEGALYDDLNGYGGDWHVQSKLTELLEKENLYYEQGESWNLGLYPINKEG